jgi:hypothetical protein
MDWIVILIFAGYGLFCFVWPEKACEMYLAHFNVGAQTKWYKPNTYLKYAPSAIAFRCFGVVLLGIGVFLIYIKYSPYALVE